MVFLAVTQWSAPVCRGTFAGSKTTHMHTKQTIAVIGATGNMGTAISKSLARGNYRMLLRANDPAKVQGLIHDIKATHAEADVEAIDCPVKIGRAHV